MAKQKLETTTKQKQRMVGIIQRELGYVLEKNGVELAEMVENQLAENPALERKTDDTDDINQKTEDGKDFRETSEQLQAADYGDEDNAPQRPSRDDSSPRYRASNRSADDEIYTPTAISEVTLLDYLGSQLGELELTPVQQLIAVSIVGNLDSNGYLTRSVDAIADDVTINNDEGLEVSSQEVREVLDIVQSLDPPGIAARNLRECMLLQLKRLPQSSDTDLAIQMVENHFNDIENSRYDNISQGLGITRERVDDIMTRQIKRKVNPKPGSSYAGSRSDNSQQVTPDFVVEKTDDGLTLTLQNHIPDLQISETYSRQVKKYEDGSPLSVMEQEEKKSVRDSYDRASRFIEVLKLRQQTLFATMRAIMQFQRDFFETGDERQLHPLVQRQVGDAIGKDVTVVSRAINNKYVQTPWGIRDLKSFFSEDINGESRHEVQDALKQLIDVEDKRDPLSDDQLCQKLNQMGYKLHRRTVAKYRVALKIPNSTHRRQAVNKS